MIFVRVGEKKYANDVKRMRSEEKLSAQERTKWRAGKLKTFNFFLSAWEHTEKLTNKFHFLIY